MKYFNLLKSKWGIKTNQQLIIIFLVFGITGTSSMMITDPILDFFDINKEFFSIYSYGDIVYWMIRLIIIFPIYQLLLIAIGFIFNQFDFFWEFEKEFLSKIGFKRFFKKK
tara:strand:- start:4 stop:336 length:333 start_codon:yes stop_codon:yes gene_type:complete